MVYKVQDGLNTLVLSCEPPLSCDPDPNWKRWFRTDKGMQPVRDGNNVIGLIDGNATFESMVDAIETATGSDHYIYMLNWWMELDLELVPKGKPKGGSTDTQLINLLTNAVSNGVQVRAMIWDDATNPETSISNWNTPQVDRINGIPDNKILDATGTSIIFANAAAILDNNTLNLGSHHQKILIVKGTKGLIAFCGGVDFNKDRVNSLSPPRQIGSPIHDVHCRIKGPAAWDLLQIFIHRWNDHIDGEGLDNSKGKLRGIGELLPESLSDNLHVQIGRTFGNGSKHPGIISRGINSSSRRTSYSFAPEGERTVEKMIFHAIEQAEKFIYIEDQYLVYMNASNKLRAQLPKIEFLIILIPHSSISDFPHIWEMRKNFIDNLKADPATRDKVVVCYRIEAGSSCPNPATVLPTPHTYVHSKMFIIDDKFVVIGSANCNSRGYTHDSEVIAGIFDGLNSSTTDSTSAITFAQTLRMDLWSEHLNRSRSDVFDLSSSAHHWFAPPRTSSIAIYDPNAGKDKRSVAPRRYVDPFGG